MTDDPILTLNHVALGYPRRVVLPDVNLLLSRGSFTGLLGANGSGKSTLIKAVLDIIPPLSGEIKFALVNGRSPVFGYVPQRDTLDSIYLLSSFEVALMGAYGKNWPGHRVTRAEKDWVLECLRESGADHLRRTLFSQLSGGQKQRVLMARALATKPDFLLLDEPTAGIDAAAREGIMEVLRRVHAQRPLTILMSSHDLQMVRAYARDAVWLHQGQVLHGPVDTLLTTEKIKELLELQLQ